MNWTYRLIITNTISNKVGRIHWMDEYFNCFLIDYTAGPSVPKSITTKMSKIPCTSNKKVQYKTRGKEGEYND